MNTVVFRGLAQPQLSRLSEDLALLEYSDPGAVRARLSTNGFALLADRGASLFDTGADELLPLINVRTTRRSLAYTSWITTSAGYIRRSA
jgi:hypothetical protein